MCIYPHTLVCVIEVSEGLLVFTCVFSACSEHACSGYFVLVMWSQRDTYRFSGVKPKMLCAPFASSLFSEERGRTGENLDSAKASVATGSQRCCLLSDFLSTRLAPACLEHVFPTLRAANVRTYKCSESNMPVIQGPRGHRNRCVTASFASLRLCSSGFEM